MGSVRFPLPCPSPNSSDHYILWPVVVGLDCRNEPSSRPGPGDFELQGHHLQPLRTGGGRRPARVRQHLPGGRLGGAGPGGAVADHSAGGARSAGQRRPQRRGHCRHRHHQPAGNHARLGPADGPLLAQRHRLAGSPYGRPLRADASGWPGGCGGRDDGPDHRPLFLGN